MRKAVCSFLIAIVLALAGAASAGPFEDGSAAYARRDYAKALALWRPLAEQGDVRAQFYLGVMFNNGQGVKPDYVQSYVWFSRAAAGGDNVALMFRDSLPNLMNPTQIAEARRLTRERNAR